MPVLNGRFMEENLKKGWTAKECASRLGCSTEEFLQRLKITFKNKPLKEMMARLETNEKLAARKNKNSSKKQSDSKINIETTAQKIDSQNTIAPKEESSDILAELFKEKEKLEEVLNSFELEHKELYSERNDIRNEISAHMDILIKLKDEVLKHTSELDSLSKKLDVKLSKMQELNICISETHEKISEVNHKISSLTRLEILVYSSGEFEVLNSDDTLEIPSFDDCFNELITHTDELEELRVKEIKILAKCLTLAKTLQEENKNFSFTFEDKIIEDYFILKTT